MSSRTPAGFYFASVCAAAFGACMALVAGPMENLGYPHETILVRASAGLLACLSGVAAEALWRARPWAYRSTLALALAYPAVVTLLSLGLNGQNGLTIALWILFFSAWVVVPIVIYVRNRSAMLFGPRRRQPRPAPRAPLAHPTAAGGGPQP